MNGKKSQAFNAQAQYTFDVTKIEEFLMNGKYITFSQDHQLPSKEDLRRKIYYKYHNSWNQN